MVDEIIIRFSVKDDGTPQIEKLNKTLGKTKEASQSLVPGLEGAAKGVTGFLSANAALIGVLVSVGVALGKITQASQQYADDVRKISAVSGESAENSSRFLQVLDDYEISAQDALTATRALTNNGLKPNIETLARLSDKYKSLSSVEEKNKFVIENLGRAGLQWTTALEKGGAALRAQGDAVSDSLILNEKYLAQSQDLKASQDLLGEQWQAFAYSTAPALKNAWGTVLDAASYYLIILGKMKDGMSFSEASNFALDEIDASKAAFALADGTKAASEGIGTQTSAMTEAKSALSDYKSMLEAVSQANLDMEGMSRDIAKSQKQYAEDHAQAAATLSKAITEGDAEGIAKARKDIQDLEATWHESANNMIYDMVLVGLSAGGLLDSEQKALDEYAVKAGIKTQADIDEANRRREVADATINGILQSEDVLAEQRRVDAETLRLTEAQTSAEKLAAAGNEAAAMGQVSAATQKEIELQMILAAKARNTAIQYSNIKMVGPNMTPFRARPGTTGGRDPDSRDSGGAGIAGTPYMIGTGAQPEIFIPSTNGTFVPNADKKGALGGVTYNIVINNPKRETAENSIRSSLKNLIYTGSAA